MSLFELVVVSAILWWMVFFACLPFGVRPLDDPEPGHSSGAPEHPRLWLKAAVTTGITIVLVTGLHLLVGSGLLPPMREIFGG